MADEKSQPPAYIAGARAHGIFLRQSAPVSRGPDPEAPPDAPAGGSISGGAEPPGPGPKRPPGPRGILPFELPIIKYLNSKDRRVILASASPRRRQLLAQVPILLFRTLPPSGNRE